MKVLLIDDERITLTILGNFLTKTGYEIRTIVNATNLEYHLDQFKPNIVITDVYMTPYSGIDVCNIVRNYDSWIYIIVISSDTDVETLTEAFEVGANDFIRKPINDSELSCRLANASKIIKKFTYNETVITAMTNYSTMLEHNAQLLYEQLITDQLTAIHNRRYAETILNSLWTRYERDRIPFFIISIDIDKFKSVNDTYGHDIGDIILTHVATMLKNSIRGSDIVCRMGGEEFIVVGNNTNETNLGNLCEKLRKAINDNQPILQNFIHVVTISVGGTMAKSIDTTWYDTYKRSDRAMYAAKNDGRNCVKIN